jgi:hypothetical protein
MGIEKGKINLVLMNRRLSLSNTLYKLVKTFFDKLPH